MNSNIWKTITQIVIMGGLWWDITIMFWIYEYSQRLIYIWNKFFKCIMCWCGMNFQSILTFNIFESIKYFNGVLRALHVFQINDSKVIINVNEFPSLLKSTMQQPPKFNSQNQMRVFIGMKILIMHLWTFWKTIKIQHRNMLFHCSTFFSIQILLISK